MNASRISERLYSIAPHAPFLPQLVSEVLEGPLLGDWPRDNPFWLADVTIILPTERARLALSSAFAAALNGGALLPDIRTLGGDEGEASHFEDPATKLNSPKTILPMERQFLLSQLVEKWAKHNGQNSPLDAGILRAHPARILSLAQSLGELIDELNTEGVRPSALRAVPDLDLNPARSKDLAANFLANLDFLEIVLSRWPQILKEANRIDASALKVLQVEHQIKNLDAKYAHRPVIAAGSTGSVPSTAKLLKAIANLERGCVVLPGFNTQLNEQQHRDLLETSNAPHGHPQYGLSQLLRRLGQSPSVVRELAPSPKNKRNEIVRDALALAKDTSDWNKARSTYCDKGIEAAFSKIGIIVAKNERQQALAIALAARAARARGESVGIVTPDRNFARRITVELKRFGIQVDDSAGMPLYHTATGRLVRQILSLALSDFSPVDLMSLLRNKNVQFASLDAGGSDTITLLEHGLLRGQRPLPGVKGLHQILRKNINGELDHPALKLDAITGAAVGRLVDDIEATFSPMAELLRGGKFTAAELANRLLLVFLDLTNTASRKNEHLNGFSQLKEWVEELATTDPAGPELTPSDAMAVLRSLMGNISVRSAGKNLQNVSIWGRLEARMQSVDLMILASLNEEVWPEIADPGPWLSRGMRLDAGLEPPERHQGLAAHDFEMAMGNNCGLICYCERIGSTPALPSRLVSRLCGFIGDEATLAMQERGKIWLEQAERADRSYSYQPAGRPMPCPPIKLRPRSISITDVETLIRDPFSLYAKYVLGLSSLSPLGEDVSHRERGTLIHAVFAAFVEANHDPVAENAHQILMEIAQETFAGLQNMPERREIWLKRLAKSAQGFLDFERAREGEINARFAEQKLQWSFDIAGQNFTLHGKADRIDVRHDGKLEIIDFKTGNPPSKQELQHFLAPQLFVEAAIADANGFEKQKKAKSHSLQYIKVGADPAGFTPMKFYLPPGKSIMEATDDLFRITCGRINEFLLSDNLAMTSRIMPKTGQNYAGTYDHLARVDEWSEIEGDENE